MSEKRYLTIEELLAVQALLKHHGIHGDGGGISSVAGLLALMDRHGLRTAEEIVELADVLLLLELHGIRPPESMLRLFRRLLHQLECPRYTVTVTQETTMAIGNITAGTSGTFAAVLNDNGTPIALPSGSTFAWTASDSTVSIVPSSDTTSAVVNIPAGDPGTSVTVTASTVGPDGNTYSGSVTVPLTPVPQQFTVTVTQTA
jgi:hypothetical protein